MATHFEEIRRNQRRKARCGEGKMERERREREVVVGDHRTKTDESRSWKFKPPPSANPFWDSMRKASTSSPAKLPPA